VLDSLTVHISKTEKERERERERKKNIVKKLKSKT